MPSVEVYHVDGTVDLVPLPPKKDRLKFLQDLVGGYIETIPDPDTDPDREDNSKYYVLVLDEEGLLKNKPINPHFVDPYGFGYRGVIVKIKWSYL